MLKISKKFSKEELSAKAATGPFSIKILKCCKSSFNQQKRLTYPESLSQQASWWMKHHQLIHAGKYTEGENKFEQQNLKMIMTMPWWSSYDSDPD